MPWSWKCRAIPLPPLWAVLPVQSLIACTRGALYLYLLIQDSDSRNLVMSLRLTVFFSQQCWILTVMLTCEFEGNNVPLLQVVKGLGVGFCFKWVFNQANYLTIADPSGHAVQGVGLRPLACWDCGFESQRDHGSLYVVSVVCCQVEVSATSWSIDQRSPNDCVVLLCVK